MPRSFSINPIGIVRNAGDEVWIEVFDDFVDGLLGLEGFSHILVFYWFDQNDSPENRLTLQVHPQKDPDNPLTGVFATHAPVRPNLIALSRCKIISIKDNIITLDEIDALDRSPVIDIKCYIPHRVEDVRLPEWVRKNRDDTLKKTDDR